MRSQVKGLRVEAIIRSGLRTFTDEAGHLWCSLADYFIRQAQFEQGGRSPSHEPLFLSSLLSPAARAHTLSHIPALLASTRPRLTKHLLFLALSQLAMCTRRPFARWSQCATSR